MLLWQVPVTVHFDHGTSKEDLMEYIQRFRERVLGIHEAYDERELVKVCIQGMFDEYRVHLENLSLSTFATLVEAARRTNNTVHRQKESYKNRRNVPGVHSIQAGKDVDRSSKRPRGDFRRRNDQGVDAPPFPASVSVERVRALLQQWVRDGQVNLPYVARVPTNQEKAAPNYCDYHRRVNHAFVDCRNMRRLLHRKIESGEVIVGTAGGVRTDPLPVHRG